MIQYFYQTKHYIHRNFWQFVFGDNSLSLPVDWWHNYLSMFGKVEHLLNIVA